ELFRFSQYDNTTLMGLRLNIDPEYEMYGKVFSHTATKLAEGQIQNPSSEFGFSPFIFIYDVFN
ncbi:MAG: hypothetical protein Q8755_02965, partial [Candidatus Phytoplasma australasiaticum]|nr:hypothetical protein [Candidatus Phytoplasma australasiaticum]